MTFRELMLKLKRMFKRKRKVEPPIEPPLPSHPNCRCCLVLPEEKENEDPA